MPPIIAFDADVVGRRRTGDETWTTEVLCALGMLDLPFRVLAYLREPSALPERALANGLVTPVRVAIRSNYVRALAAMPARLRTDRPSLYQGTYFLPRALPCPGVVAVHDCSFLRHTDFMPALDRIAFRRFVPWSVRRAARVIALSEFTRRDLLELVPGLDPDRVITIHPGVSDHFRPVEDARRLAAAGFGLHEPYVLFLGALQRRKNLARLLEAWALLRAERPDRPETLVLAGEVKSGASDDIDALINRLGVATSVRRTGYIEGRDDLRLLLSGARALAFPSLYEGFGLPALEAMACGTPVVASNTTAMPETTGGAAILVDPLDPRDIASGLRVLMRDEGERERWRARGLAHVRGRSWTLTAERLASVYAEILPATRPALMPAVQPCATPNAEPSPTATDTPATVTASVVSGGESHLLRACLTAVHAQQPGMAIRAVVVCNREGDGSAAVAGGFPDTTVIENAHPRGFAANHNLALKHDTSDFVLIMNPDVTLAPGCVAALLALMKTNARCGMAVPVLRYPNGGIQPSARRFPKPIGSLVRRTPLRLLFSRQRYGPDHYLPVPSAPRTVDWALGACLLVRRTAWQELGGFDERAFPRLYVEDIDLGWRLWQAGWEVWQSPGAVAVHEHQAATDRRFIQRRTLWHFQGMWNFIRRHPGILVGYRPALSRPAAGVAQSITPKPLLIAAPDTPRQ